METESGQSNNRLFMLLAVAMIGLICIGLMGLGGVTYFTLSSRAQEEAAVPPTPTPIPPTPTLTATPTETPTETPPPTPTATLVIPVGGAEAGTPTPLLEASPTPTPALGTRILEGTPSAELTATPVPATGMPGSGGVLAAGNGLLGWTGIGLLLLLIVGVANHFRLFSGKF